MHIPGQPAARDLLRDVRRIRWAARAAVGALILTYAAWDRMMLGFSWEKTALDLTPALIFGNAILEGVYALFCRLQKRSLYPHTMAVELGVAHDLRQAGDTGMRLAAQWLGARAAILTWLDGAQGIAPVASYGLPGESIRRLTPPSPDQPPIATVIREQRAVTGKVRGYPYWSGLFDDSHRVAYVPLISRDRVVAIMSLVGPRRAADLRDSKLLEAMGMVIGLSLDNLRLNQRQYESIMQVLCSALDMRDRATEGHSQRVAYLASLVAQQMGMPRTEINEIAQAAVLHDIGKIGVADAVLSKPGPLNEDEWGEMRRHPHLGYEIIRDIESLRDVANIVYSHHEHLDGNGYPRGLSGEAIPLGARIFSVVDAYDAITSERPYRRARSHADAVEEIVRHAGSQFDPEVVEAFLEVERLGLIRPLDHLDDGFAPKDADIQLTVGE